MIKEGCPEVFIMSYEDLTWTDEDAKVIPRAQEGCKKHYGPDSCLKKIIKVKEDSFYAICQSHSTTHVK